MAAALARPRAAVQGLGITLGALTGGLLSSSCCILQLLLNLTPIGCAGFSVLTPYQPYFRLATGGLLAYLLASHGINRRSLTTIALSLALMASQDALRMHNSQGGLMQALALWLQRQGLASEGDPTSMHVTLVVGGLRCEGCAAHLRGSLAAVAGVHNASVHFKEGVAEVWADSRLVGPDVLVEVVERLDPTYTAQLSGAACFDRTSQPAACPPCQAGGSLDSKRQQVQHNGSSQQEL